MTSIKEGVRTTLAENFGGTHDKAAKPSEQFGFDVIPDQSGKMIVITGGTEGIGYGCVYGYLSKNAAKVIALSPSKKVYEGARDSIERDLGADLAKRYEWIQLDLSDWQATTEAAAKVAKSVERIDALALNAGRGIMTAQLTDKGVDRHMALNHFGHVIFTSHLLPLLKKSAETGTVRIATQASNAHQAAPKDTKFASLEEINKDEGANGQYGRSKLANLLYARYLARHLSASHPSICVSATHPGFVDTKMSSEDIHEPFPIAGYAMSAIMKPFKKDQYEGAVSMLYATTATEETGKYYCPPAIAEPGSDLAQDKALGEQLMKLTVQIVQDKFPQAQANGCPFSLY